MTTNIDGVQYYDIKFISVKNPDISGGCQTLRDIVRKNKIPENKYLFVSYSQTKNKYTVLPKDTKYKSKRLLVELFWVHKHIHPFCKPGRLVLSDDSPASEVEEDNNEFAERSDAFYTNLFIRLQRQMHDMKMAYEQTICEQQKQIKILSRYGHMMT